MTWIIDELYFHSDGKTEILREQFEGMLVQGERLTPVLCLRDLYRFNAGRKTRISEELNDSLYLMVTMNATNQEPYKTRIFVNWEKACNKTRTAILSIWCSSNSAFGIVLIVGAWSLGARS